MKKHPKVNEVNEFLETASDFEDPLEVLRESLSNSYDANASTVTISIQLRNQGTDIVIEDDGDGMNADDLEAFFDLGNSQKTDSIGYKGHGTKIFYKSDKIVVNTAQDGVNRRAVMNQPWEKLNNKRLPEYEVTSEETRSENTGTHIRITGFRAGEGFQPESLTYNKIHHYLKWKTIAGSTKHFFTDDHHEMDVKVILDDSIDDNRDQLVTTNKFEFPSEQLQPTDGRFPTERMCRHFGPREVTVGFEGGETTLEIVGMIGGKQARNELPTYGRHSAQFGVWLATDHIKIEQYNQAISSDNEFLHFFFIANCQDLELSANRVKVRNKSSSVYQAITEELEHFMSKVSAHPWFKNYLELRKQAKQERKAESESAAIDERIDFITDQSGFEPTNIPEVVAAVERSNRNGHSCYQIEDLEPANDINAIVRTESDLIPAMVLTSLTDMIDLEIPLTNTELILCWDYGDRDDLRRLERTGYAGGDITFNLEDKTVQYRNGSSHEVDLVQVSERLATSPSMD